MGGIYIYIPILVDRFRIRYVLVIVGILQEFLLCPFCCSKEMGGEAETVSSPQKRVGKWRKKKKKEVLLMASYHIYI